MIDACIEDKLPQVACGDFVEVGFFEVFGFIDGDRFVGRYRRDIGGFQLPTAPCFQGRKRDPVLGRPATVGRVIDEPALSHEGVSDHVVWGGCHGGPLAVGRERRYPIGRQTRSREAPSPTRITRRTRPVARKKDSEPASRRQEDNKPSRGKREETLTTLADDLRRERDLRLREQAEALKRYGFYSPELRKNSDLSKYQKERTRALWREFGQKIEGAERDDGAFVALKLSGTKKTKRAARNLLRENGSTATDRFVFVERQKSYNVYEARVKTKKVGKRREAEVTIFKSGVDKRGREVTRAKKIVGGKQAMKKKNEINNIVKRLKETGDPNKKVMLRFYGNTVGRNMYESVEDFEKFFLERYAQSLNASELNDLLSSIEIIETDRRLSKKEIADALGETSEGDVVIPKGFRRKATTVKVYRL